MFDIGEASFHFWPYLPMLHLLSELNPVNSSLSNTDLIRRRVQFKNYCFYYGGMYIYSPLQQGVRISTIQWSEAR